MVFDVPATSGGALSILKDFHNNIISCENKDINWIFVVSEPVLKKTENIEVLNFPWVKKSWFHRLYFDNIVAPQLVEKHNIDKILSFQNVTIPNTRKPQMLYVHQSLPFVEYKFKFSENKKLWIYQNIIGKLIIKSIKRADKVIVQTNWMKEACIEKINISRSKIYVQQPKINIRDIKSFIANKDSLSTFFYPAGALSYKNHKLIVEACKRLKEMNLDNYKVIFTLNGEENEDVKRLKNDVKKNNLPIEFAGTISREEVFNLYTKSVLIFPSYIETFGLPMLEARLHKGMILASDCPFSNEILEEYENVYFFDPFKEEQLAKLMEDVLTDKVDYKIVKESVGIDKKSGWEELLDVLVEM